MSTNWTSARFVRAAGDSFHVETAAGTDHQHNIYFRRNTAKAGQANYASSKAGLIGLTMAIAREVGSRSITCNAVSPGFIETAMTSVLTDEFRQNALKMIPLGRVGSVDDVANCVSFLASEEAAYITGHVLNVNGGMLMG